MIEDKGGFGAVEFDADVGIIHGEVVKARDGITFQGHFVLSPRCNWRFTSLAMTLWSSAERVVSLRSNRFPANSSPGFRRICIVS